jgi:hypothetical protein
MSLDTTPVTVTLPAWYVDRISEDAERESLHYAGKLRAARTFHTFPPETTAEHVNRMQEWKARWESVESAINDALDTAGLL